MATRLIGKARKEFEQIAGRLIIETVPAGAEVRSADGKLISRTGKLMWLEPGWHELSVIRSGYLAEKRRIRITTGTNRRQRIKL